MAGPPAVSVVEVSPASRPGARRSAGAAVEGLADGGERGWIFAGYNGSTLQDSAAYLPQVNAWAVGPTGPAQHERHALAYDAAKGRVVLFGGGFFNFPFPTVYAETWGLDPVAGAWTKYTNSAQAPAARLDTSLFWIPHQQRLLLYGGMGSYTADTPAYNDVWALAINPDGGVASWTPLVTTGTPPPGFAAPCAAYDPAAHELHVFGGRITNSTNAFSGSTHRLNVDTLTWSDDAPSGSIPAARGYCGTTWDADAGLMLLVGGQAVADPVTGIFLYDPLKRRWYDAAPDGGLTGTLSDPSAWYSPLAGSSFVFGGRDAGTNYTNRMFQLTVTPGTNAPPAADAGSDFTVGEASGAVLPGSASDPDNDQLTVRWTQTSGPAVALSDAGSLTPSFTAPRVVSATPLGFQLAVSDGVAQALSAVQVTVLDTIDEPPLPDAGPGQTAPEASVVTLDATGSTDPNGEPLTFSWTQSAGPAATLTADGGFAWVQTPRVLAPQALDFQVVVSDPRGGSAPAAVRVTVLDTIDEPPVADGGTDLVVGTGSNVVLTGSAVDPNGEAVTLSWGQVSGPVVQLISAGVGAASFLAPPSAGTLGFQLTAQDPRGGTGTAQVSVQVVSGLLPPAFTSTPPAEAACRAAYQYLPVVEGAGPLSFSLQGAPAGMAVDPSTGAVSWTPEAAQTGVQGATLVVTGPGGSTSQPLAVTVSCPASVLDVACGCGASPAGGAPALLLALAWWWRRRRRATAARPG